MVNLILNKPAVTELIQNDLNANQIKKELTLVLNTKRAAILTDYSQLIETLGNSGASEKAASAITEKYL